MSPVQGFPINVKVLCKTFRRYTMTKREIYNDLYFVVKDEKLRYHYKYNSCGFSSCNQLSHAGEQYKY